MLLRVVNYAVNYNLKLTFKLESKIIKSDLMFLSDFFMKLCRVSLLWVPKHNMYLIFSIPSNLVKPYAGCLKAQYFKVHGRFSDLNNRKKPKISIKMFYKASIQPSVRVLHITKYLSNVCCIVFTFITEYNLDKHRLGKQGILNCVSLQFETFRVEYYKYPWLNKRLWA